MHNILEGITESIGYTRAVISAQLTNKEEILADTGFDLDAIIKDYSGYTLNDAIYKVVQIFSDHIDECLTHDNLQRPISTFDTKMVYGDRNFTMRIEFEMNRAKSTFWYVDDTKIIVKEGEKEFFKGNPELL